MGERVPVGDVLDGLGITAKLKPDDLVASAVVVMSVLPTGSSNPRLVIADSETMSWIEQAGLLILASKLATLVQDEDEDDE